MAPRSRFVSAGLIEDTARRRRALRRTGLFRRGDRAGDRGTPRSITTERPNTCSNFSSRISSTSTGWSRRAIASSTAACGSAHPVRVDDEVLRALEQLDSARSRCISRRPGADLVRSHSAPAPCLPQIACFDTAFHRTAAAVRRRRSRCPLRSPTAACGAAASTACRTSTSPARCRRSDGKSPRAGVVVAISAMAHPCARSPPA